MFHNSREIFAKSRGWSCVIGCRPNDQRTEFCKSDILGTCPSSKLCQSSISSLNITCSKGCHSEVDEASLNIAR